MDQANHTIQQHSDHPHDECGVFAISARHHETARQTYFGLYALQHRGQEAAGMAVSDGRQMQIHKGLGLVDQVFTEEIVAQLHGYMTIGHTRYSTTGSSTLRNVQPLQVETRYGPVALAHNGNLVNAAELRLSLFEKGMGLTSSSDTEVMLMMLASTPGDTWIERIANSMKQWVGAYSVVILTLNGTYAARDPWGLRPLTIGQLPEGGHAAASETGALQTIGCTSVREVKPGEIVALQEGALIVRQAMPPAQPQAKCTFEHIYFSRPDSIWDDKVVHEVRMNLGRNLAKESGVDADVVVPVPDSSIPAALGYAEASHIPYNVGLLKNRYIGRTFIQPSQAMRDRDVFLKYSPLPSVLSGKRVIVIDDSIVRGTTLKRLVKMLREAGALEIHLRITCPPIIAPCFMGVDMSTYDELIAHKMSVDEMDTYLGADSLHFISMEGMMKAIGSKDGYCNACFTDSYPFPVQNQANKLSFESPLDISK